MSEQDFEFGPEGLCADCNQLFELDDGCEATEPALCHECEKKRLEKKIAGMRQAVIRFVIAQGPHLPESWKDFFAKEFDLERDMGNPYQHLKLKSG